MVPIMFFLLLLALFITSQEIPRIAGHNKASLRYLMAYLGVCLWTFSAVVTIAATDLIEGFFRFLLPFPYGLIFGLNILRTGESLQAYRKSRIASSSSD